MVNDQEGVARVLLESPLVGPVLRRWSAIDLPDAWVSAGAIAQTVWNHLYGYDPQHGIDDIDIVYFDALDLTEEAEGTRARRISAQWGDLGHRVDVKNEARVHLWYESRFGKPLQPYMSSADAIGSFPCTATAIGVRPHLGALEFCAPFGLADLTAGIIRPNYRLVPREVYEAKVARWTSQWPQLDVVEWEDAAVAPAS